MAGVVLYVNGAPWSWFVAARCAPELGLGQSV